MAINYVKFQRGSLAAYEALKSASRVDENTLYFIYENENEENGSLYLGYRLIGGNLSANEMNLADLADVITTGADTNYFLVRNSEGKWVATSPEEVANLIVNKVSVSTQVFQIVLEEGQTDIEAIEKEISGLTINIGDIAIVKDEFVEGKIEHTAYVYNGEEWVAMDGNYNASNVYFDEDFVFTKAIGTVTIPASGSKKVDAAGKSLKQFFAGLFAQEETTNLIKTNPSVSGLTVNETGSYEVGTVLTPTYSATFNAGAYDYGPSPTGVVVNNWKITSTNGDDISGADKQTGSLASLTVGADTVYSVTAEASYDAGSYALTNLGNTSTERIAAGTKSKTASSAITGYRNSFYGTFADKTTELNSANIRALTKSGKTLKAGDTFTIDIAPGALRTILAVPATLTPSYVGHREGLNAPLLDSNTVKYTVSIDGAVAGKDAIDYTVYVWSYANPYASLEHYDVTV